MLALGGCAHTPAPDATTTVQFALSDSADSSAPLRVAATRVVASRAGLAARELGLVTVPTVLVIDRSGVVRYVNDGFHPGDDTVIAQQVATLQGDGDFSQQ
jgi:hypothetical protein